MPKARSDSLNPLIRQFVEGIPIGSVFQTSELNRAAVRYNRTLHRKKRAPERQAMCELERISVGGRARYAASDESVIFAYRGGKGGAEGRLVPRDIWLRHGGTDETRGRGYYLRVRPGNPACHWHEARYLRRNLKPNRVLEAMFDLQDRGLPVNKDNLADRLELAGSAARDRTHRAQRAGQSQNHIFLSNFNGERKSIDRIKADGEQEEYGDKLATHALFHFIRTYEQLVELEAPDALRHLTSSVKLYVSPKS